MAEAKQARPEADRPALGMGEAIAMAKIEFDAINDLPIDQVIRSERREDGGWVIVLEVIESPARMGENDFLAAFSLTLDARGALEGVERVDRYRREENGGTAGR